MKKRLLCLCLPLCLLFLLAGCGAEANYDDIETSVVQCADGFSFSVPTAWQMLAPDDDGADTTDTAAYADNENEEEYAADFSRYHFLSEDGQLSLLVLTEMGGMEYNSSDTYCELMSDEMLSALFAEGEKEQLSVDDNHYRQLISGQGKDGSDLVCVVDLWHPYTSVRYYMIFTATAAAYKKDAYIIAGIEDSLCVTAEAEELYQQMQDQRDAEREALLEEMEQIQQDMDADDDTSSM